MKPVIHTPRKVVQWLTLRDILHCIDDSGRLWRLAPKGDRWLDEGMTPALPPYEIAVHEGNEGAVSDFVGQTVPVKP